MKEAAQHSLCLLCGKTILDTPHTMSWHVSCCRSFFGTSILPIIDITTTNFSNSARISITEGNTVTGVQKKMSVHLEDTMPRKRLTVQGFPSGYILKPPVDEFPDLPELEHVVMSLADALGIKTVPHALIQLHSGEFAYITRRIDRGFPQQKHSEKFHMEDFCQLSQRLSEDKYKGSLEQCGKLILTHSSQAGLDAADFFFRALFSFVTGNADMHLKNFSLFLSPTGWMLAPAYDLVPTKLVLPADKEESALHINGKKNHLTRPDFHALAKNLKLTDKAVDNFFARAQSIPKHFAHLPAVKLLAPQRQKELENLIQKRTALLSEG